MQNRDYKSQLKLIDYKDIDTLRKFLNPSGKILPRKLTRISLAQQRKIAQAIKRARFMGLLPYVDR